MSERWLLRLVIAVCALACGGKEDSAGTPEARRSGAGGSVGQSPGAVDVAVLDEAYGPYLSDVVDLALGVRTSCAVHADGRVSCWGADWLEVLGQSPTLEPRFVEGISDAIDVAVAFTAACAITRGGEVSCWGSGPVANAALGDEPQYTAPRLVEGLSNVSVLSAANEHMCAIAEGRVACLGAASSLGAMFGRAAAAEPYWVAELEGVRALAVFMGREGCQLLAALEDGSVECLEARVDEESPSGRFIREPVGLTATQIDGGCLVSNGDVYCMGGNATGRLGRPFAELSETDSFVPIAGVRNIVQVAAGDLHNCALDADGQVWCWGGNSQGQLGRDYRSPAALEPARLPLAQRATDLDAGDLHTCALLETQNVLCWGYNEHGEIGDGSLRPALVPTPVRAAD